METFMGSGFDTIDSSELIEVLKRLKKIGLDKVSSINVEFKEEVGREFLTISFCDDCSIFHKNNQKSSK